MKHIFILIIFALILSACSLGSKQQKGIEVTAQHTNGSATTVVTPTPAPINNQQEVKTAVDDLSQELDAEFGNLDYASDFTDTTEQDFGQ